MHLFIFGFGNSSRAIARALESDLSSLTVTVRSQEKAEALRAEGIEALVFDGSSPSLTVTGALNQATHVLSSVPPDDAGDPVLTHFMRVMATSDRLEWIGYLSTVGVYGDHQGGWVDELTPPHPTSRRSIRRASAEWAWEALGKEINAATALFRLAGIYGPGHSTLERLRDGTARRLIKSGQVFNRIHVEDIGRVVAQAARQKAEGVFNLSDNEPAPPQDVVAFGAELLGLPLPEEMDFDSADLTPMARSFYGENKRVRNDRIKAVLGLDLLYPSYREGLRAILDEEGTTG